MMFAVAQVEPSTFLTPDSEFHGVEPPVWVLDGVAEVLLPLEDLKSIEETAAIGATVLPAGGPSPYYPRRRDDPRLKHLVPNLQASFKGPLIRHFTAMPFRISASG